MARKLTEIEAVVEEGLLERHLSPMGKLALRSANWDLARAEEDSHLWRDAGMISLGFFRILELEFNERLIFPATRAIDLDALERHREALKASQLQGGAKKAVDFWEKMMGPLRRAKNDRKGLERGTLEKLLLKVARVDGVDRELKAMVRSGLIVRLSGSGTDALNMGGLARLLDEWARERFRNPPAHSRYVDLGTARDCKTYVEAGLNQLIDYTTVRANEKPSIH